MRLQRVWHGDAHAGEVLVVGRAEDLGGHAVEIEARLGRPRGGAEADGVRLVAAPAKMSETPVTYRRPPPVRGEHTIEVLEEVLGLREEEIVKLESDGVTESKKQANR